MKFKRSIYKMLSFLLLSVLSLSLLAGCTPEETELATDVLTAIEELEVETEEAPPAIAECDENEEANLPEESPLAESILSEDGVYTTKEDVAAYLHEYGHLPSNFITKKEAKELGWVSSEGNLDEVAPGMSIGGDYFGNYEGLLPEADGRDYYECDIDFDGTYRNAKRIVFSNDGLIYYTEDHYESFELLYGEE